MASNAIEWTRHRARLNHDVLCNMVLVELAAARPGRELPRLSQWLDGIGDYRALFRATTAALDAGLLLDRPLFACWTAEMRQVFKPVFRELYLRDHQVRECAGRLLALLAECEVAARAALAEDADSAALQRAEILLRELSNGIAQLPDPMADFGLRA